jgi:hypothetical protein
MDTRRSALLPAQFHGSVRRLAAGETIDLVAPSSSSIRPALPKQVSALVVNLTATNAAGAGFIRASPKGGNLAAQRHSNLNFVAGVSSANTAIVPTDAGGRISLYSSTQVDVVVDVVGYITSTGAPKSGVGTFVPIAPTRVYSTRFTNRPFAAGETRLITVAGGSTKVPAGIGGISANISVAAPTRSGFLVVFPGSRRPSTSNVNYGGGRPATNGALVRVNPGAVSNTVTGFMSQAGHVIIDVNGYFVAAPS